MSKPNEPSEYDRDTLNYLRAAGVDPSLVARVQASLSRPDLSGVDTYALAVELTRRGFLKVEMLPAEVSR